MNGQHYPGINYGSIPMMNQMGAYAQSAAAVAAAGGRNLYQGELSTC